MMRNTEYRSGMAVRREVLGDEEVLRTAAVYCGVPSGVEVFRVAKDVIENWSTEDEK